MVDAVPVSASRLHAVVGHRRYVTVLFSDVSDSSEHAERLEAEAYAELLDQFRQFVRQIVPAHGGSVARLQGDGVLALFGHLQSDEDDGRRATEAALALHAAVAKLRAGTGAQATALRLHSGIHAGLVLLVEGDIERGRFDVVGEVPNTAARLCSAAGPGEILVSSETLGPHTHCFIVSSLPGLAIRGRSAPLDVKRVEGRLGPARRIDAAAKRGRVPFFGRETALYLLLEGAARARRGQAQAIVLSGEPGIGKTRLIDEFQSRLDPTDFQIVQATWEGHLGSAALQPLLQALEGAAPGSAEPSAPSRPTAIVDRLVALAGEPRTLVLLLDDWQWADDASRQVLGSLWELGLPLLAVLASRPDSDDDQILAGAEHLRMQPLGAEDAEGAISAWLPRADPFVRQEVFRRSGGSPLFIEELCHAAAAEGTLAPAPRGSGIAWINSLVASRVSRLLPSHAECLRLVSVIGQSFPLWLVQRLLGDDPAEPLLEALTARDFLIAGTNPQTLRFKHALTREAVYATVESTRRRALHLQVAQALDSAIKERDASDWLDALAYHFDAADIGEQAAWFAEAAGDRALAAAALDRARAHYTTALRALDRLAPLSRPLQLRWCSIAQRLGQTCVFDPLDTSHGIKLFGRAAALARETGDRNVIARAAYWLAYVNYGRGRPRDAVRHCEEALDHALASEDRRLIAQVQATLGQALASAGRYERALPLLNDSVQARRGSIRAGTTHAVGPAYTLARTAYTLGDIGRFDDAANCFDDALAMLGDQLHPVAASVRELMCAVALWQGRWGDARTAGLAGAEIALRCRSRYLVAMGRALAACADLPSTVDEAALGRLSESTQWIEARGGAVSTSLNYGWLTQACAAAGLRAEARQHATRLLMRARAHDRHGLAMGCRALARLAIADGEQRRSAHWLDAAERAAAFRSSPRERAVNALARAESAAARGQAGEARAHGESAAEAFEAMRMAWHLDHARALLSRL